MRNLWLSLPPLRWAAIAAAFVFLLMLSGCGTTSSSRAWSPIDETLLQECQPPVLLEGKELTVTDLFRNLNDNAALSNECRRLHRGLVDEVRRRNGD